MRQFAESDIVIPDGPFAGGRFRVDRQPFSGVWYDEMESGRWLKSFVTGPSQDGKTLMFFIIPILFHLFEVRETVVCGVPTALIAGDKWKIDLLPTIQASPKFKALLPIDGAGSKGGDVESIRFRHGPTLRFLTGGGSDKSRAGFTARVASITETDGMDESGGSSREADKVTQIMARTRVYGSRARVYSECTVSVEEGRTWREYKGGTASRIIIPCPHCEAWVTPEREHLLGWRDAATISEARDNAGFHCPSCGVIWTEDERMAANKQPRLLHDGQAVNAKGEIHGEPKRTDTLGFRWSVANSMFRSAAETAADEWNAAKDPNQENSEKSMRQFVWAIPYVPPKLEIGRLSATGIAARIGDAKRGMVPDKFNTLTLGIDLGRFLCHWFLVGWGDNASSRVIDYDRLEVASDSFGEERALELALTEFREKVEMGWGSEKNIPRQVWIDSGWHPEVVYKCCRKWGERYRPCKGQGESMAGRFEKFRQPRASSATISAIGDGYYASRIEAEQLWLFHVNADHYKTFLHERLKTPVDGAGAMLLFNPADDPKAHTSLAKHLTAERKVEEFVAGKGTIQRWETVSRSNHWLDAAMLACAAAHFCGVRLLDEATPPQQPKRQMRPQPRLTTPDGRPYLITER